MRGRRVWNVAGGLVVLLGLAVWGIYTARLVQANQSLSLQLEAERQRNFSALASHVQNLQGLLGKGLVTGSIQQNLHYMGEVRRHTEAAISNFTGLPLPTQVSAATGKFLAQMGDFAYTLARREAAGQAMTAEDRERLSELQEMAARVSDSLLQAQEQMANDGFRWQPPLRFGWASLWPWSGAGDAAAAGPQSPMNLVPGGLSEMAGQMEQLPAFVYDGPFSDHVDRQQPALGGPEVDQATAAQRARQYLPQPERWRVSQVTEAGGNLPTWVVSLVPVETPAGQAPTATIRVELAKAGGHLVQLIHDRPVGQPSLNLEQARDRGRSYLAAAGMPGMEPSYAETADGYATIQYVLRQGSIRVYPDQARVRIALDTGEVVAVDATQYVMNHRERPAANPAISVEEAVLVLNPTLEVQESTLALIPDLAGTGEVLTYEFRVRHGEETYLVYVNANTGQEERILQVIQTETGTFAL